MDGSNRKSTQKILPVSYPVITTYTHHAHLLAILSNYESTFPWIYSNYIQLYMNKDYYQTEWGDFYFPFPYDLRPADFCRSIRTQKIDKDLIKLKWKNIIDFIIDGIDSDNYLHLMTNRFFIPHYDQYQKANRQHDIFIYGYDRLDELLCVADFFKGHKYSFEKVSFHDFNQSYSTCGLTDNYDYLKNTIFTYRYLNDAVYRFEIIHLKNYCELYLTNHKNYHWGIFDRDSQDSAAFGIEVYDVLKNYLIKKQQNRERDFDINIRPFYIDIRPFYLLYDHKKLMGLRLNYLREEGYLLKGGSNDLINGFTELETQALIIVKLLVKNELAPEEDIIDTIIDKLKNIEKREYDLFSMLLAEL